MALNPRDVQSGGALSGFLEALTGRFKQKQEQEDKLRQVFATALAEQQAKQLAPSAEEQAQREVLSMANEAGRVSLRPGTQPSGEGVFAEGNAASNRDRFLDTQATANQQKMELLLSVLKGRGLGGSVSPVIFDPNTRQYMDAMGNPVTRISRGTPVRNAPLSPENRAANAQAAAEGSAQGTPLSPTETASVQNFQELLKSADNIDAVLASDPGFKGQLFRTGLPFQPGAGNLSDELNNASDILLRLRSGAAINADEYRRLRSLLPRSRTALSEQFGNPNRSRQQVQRFKEATNEILTSKRTKGNFQGESASYPEAQSAKARLRAKYAR